MDRLRNIFDKVFNYIFGKIPGRSSKILEKNKDAQITQIEIKRAPIQKEINWLMNTISMGKFNSEKKRLSLEDFFHLRLCLTLNGSTKLLIEKNETINVIEYGKDSYKDEPNTETAIVNLSPMSLGEFFKNAIEKTPNDRMFKYDAFNRGGAGNCQQFVIDMLSSNGLLTPKLRSFIQQEIGELVENLPQYSTYLSRLSTDLASYVMRIIKRFKKGGIVTPIYKRKKKSIIRRTRDYRIDGGMVIAENPSPTEKKNVDTIPALLVVGEIVIPRRHTPLVEKFLRSKNIILPGMNE